MKLGRVSKSARGDVWINGGRGGEILPGSAEIRKSVTVVFELK